MNYEGDSAFVIWSGSIKLLSFYNKIAKWLSLALTVSQPIQ